MTNPTKGIRRGAVAVLVGCAAAVASTALGTTGTALGATRVTVPGSVAAALPGWDRVGAAATSRNLTVQVWLRPDLADAATFADAVATPGNAEYHHYLSPRAYTTRFGPSAGEATAVTGWLASDGLTQVHVSSGRDYVSASGTVSKIESAFGVRINRYRADGVMIQSNDRDVSVPASLASDVLSVSGLNSVPATSSASKAPSKAPACSQYWAQHVASFHPAYQRLTKGSLPICGYSADQLRSVYGATMAATGKGQTVALIEDEAPIAMPRSLADYAKSNHLPVLGSTQFRQVQSGSGSHCGSSATDAAQLPYSDEAEMDSEAVYAMAPGANQLMVIAEGCSENQALLDAALSVLTGNGAHPSASIESNSWQLPLGTESPQTVHAIDLRADAEGVGMYFASGDSPGLDVTDSDPYATAVGGTTLGIGAKNNRVFETGWSDDNAFLDNGKWTDLGIGEGASGGTSLAYAQPAYQKGVVPASMSRVHVGNRVVTDRAVPDIAADADPDTGMLTGYIGSGTSSHPGPYETEVNAGTSLASPLIAGLIADAQQGQKSSFGFINPLIYRLAGTSAFYDVLPPTASTPQQNRDAYSPSGVDVFDSQERAYTSQVTAKGYDTMTGLGVPNGQAFISGLRRLAK